MHDAHPEPHPGVGHANLTFPFKQVTPNTRKRDPQCCYGITGWHEKGNRERACPAVLQSPQLSCINGHTRRAEVMHEAASASLCLCPCSTKENAKGMPEREAEARPPLNPPLGMCYVARSTSAHAAHEQL
eukprot:143681-Pelagomonas_calceolata.AAC.5